MTSGDPVPLPCPFCGKRPQTVQLYDDRDETQILCINGRCHAQPFVGAGTLRIAINRWNKRAPRGGYSE